MAGVGVTVDLRQLKAAEKAILEVSGIPGRDIIELAGAFAESRTRKRLNEHGPAPDGTAWAPWSAIYAAKRPAKGGMLVLDQMLLDSMTHAVDSETEGQVGSAMVYARIHQLGGMAGRGRKVRIPARPYLGQSAEDDRLLGAEVGEFVREYIADALAKAARTQ
jgi:phage virion morphogenesis protein